MIKGMELVWRNVRSPLDEEDLQSTLSSLTVGGEFYCFARYAYYQSTRVQMCLSSISGHRMPLL
jgi:hypothetical protein